ncbi:MAG: ABC transporter permease subunit [Bdellovibrionota bacterium]
MIEHNPWLDRFCWLLLTLSIVLMCFPIYYCFVAATLSLSDVTHTPMTLIPGMDLLKNLKDAIGKGGLATQMLNSFIMASGITLGKISISMLSAFAISYFEFPFKKTAFWLIFITLMLPIEVRILPTYEIAANILGPFKKVGELFDYTIYWEYSILNSYSGLILPLTASATATFLFRQFFLSMPDELTDAAKMDGATPMQFFRKILLPLSKTNIAALTVIIFIYGWNQYLWPQLITTTDDMKTAVMGINNLIPKEDELPEWNIAMAGSLITMIPPILVVVFMQKWFVKGLVEESK